MTLKNSSPHPSLVPLGPYLIDTALRDQLIARVNAFWDAVAQGRIHPKPGATRPTAQALHDAASSAASYFAPPPGRENFGLHSPAVSGYDQAILDTTPWGIDDVRSTMGPRRS